MITAPEAKSQTYTERTTCRACHSDKLRHVVSLGDQFLPRFVPEIDVSLPCSPLELVQCETCELLQLAHTVNGDLLFRKFWYRSGINSTMRKALADVVNDADGLEGTWLDIGANDGYLLSQVPDHFRKIAVEPALNFRDELSAVAQSVVSDYFSADLVDEPCDVITSVAMFYDLDEPSEFVADIAALLKPDGIWINQLNDAPTMLKKLAFDSIVHEHLTYYDIHVLKQLYAKHGLKIVSAKLNDINGGSMRVVAKKTGHALGLVDFPHSTRPRVDGFARRVESWKNCMRDMLSALPGTLWCYGASTKGSVLLQYLDLNDRFFAIADRNPEKVGLKMAGSWLPITDETVFRHTKPDYAMVLPWSFADEFITRESVTMSAGTKFIFPLPDIRIVL